MLILIAVAGLQDMAARPGGLTAEDALANYRRMIAGGGGPGPSGCTGAQGREIVVCGRRGLPEPRLPLPEQRYGPGEVVRHPSEPPSATNAFAGGPQEPNRLGETLRKGVGIVKSILTGEDPNF